MGPTPQDAPARNAPASAGRRLLLGSVTALIVGACIEALSMAAFMGLRDGAYDRAELSALRAARREGGAAGPLAGPDLEAIHPYLGYVYDPDSHDPARRAQHGGFPVSDYGFLDGASPIRTASDGTLVVGVFGGSFAYFLSVHGIDALRDGLGRNPTYRGREIAIVRVALGGYKQPQQLLALSYLLALGAHFDVVVNLDGFNEVALPVAENIPKGVFPFYPRNWSGRVAGVPDHAGLTAMVTIAGLRQHRADWSGALEDSPLRYSVTANLVWWLRDHSLAVDISRAQVALAEVESRPERYGVRGPRRDYPDAAGLYDDLTRVWSRASLAMHRLCRASGIEYWHFLQPNQYLPDSKPMGAAEREVALAPPQFYRIPVERGYPALRARGAELAAAGVRFHDLSMIFRERAEPVYSDSCCHLNERGYGIVAREMAARIEADLAAQGAPATPE